MTTVKKQLKTQGEPIDWSGPQKDWKYRNIRIPNTLWERIKGAALAEGRKQGRPASAVSVMRKFLVAGLEQWEQAQRVPE